MCISKKCTDLIQIINTLFLCGGFIGAMVGASLIPQTVKNTGDIYVGSGEQYEADLRAAQLASYGFKVIVVSLIVFGYGTLSCVCMCGCNRIKCTKESVIHPSPEIIVEDIKPLKSILKPQAQQEKHIVREKRNLELNIKKWTGGVKIEDII